MPIVDREKKNEYSRRYYHEVYKKKQIQHVKRRATALRAQFKEWKATKKCLHCAEDDPICLEFHHVDPRTKDVDPANMVNHKGWSFERITEYLDRTCLVLCSNCHKKIHHQLKQLHTRVAKKQRRETCKRKKK